jgi:hypothetical protein
VDSKTIPILDAPLVATQMDRKADDPEKCEYLVRVDWIKTLSRDEAIREKGMFANQNSATKLRHQPTLERLVEVFNLDREETGG